METETKTGTEIEVVKDAKVELTDIACMQVNTKSKAFVAHMALLNAVDNATQEYGISRDNPFYKYALSKPKKVAIAVFTAKYQE